MGITEILGDRVEAITLPDALCGEGPLWDHRDGVLRWVDLWGRRLHAFDPETGRDTAIAVPQPLGAVALAAGGGLILALRDGFWRMRGPGPDLDLIADVCHADPRIGLNDGRCDRLGRFWAGTAAFDDRIGTGALYRLEPDGSVVEEFGGVTISNGLDWSPDDRIMYYVDTATGRVDVFDFDVANGSVGGRRPFVTWVGPELPDGLAVDAEGFVWVALFRGGRVERYAPDGRLDRVVRLPVSLVTNCAFGGPDLTDLYITTASHRLSEAERREQPLAGALFRIRGCGKGRRAHFCGAGTDA